MVNHNYAKLLINTQVIIAQGTSQEYTITLNKHADKSVFVLITGDMNPNGAAATCKIELFQEMGSGWLSLGSRQVNGNGSSYNTPFMVTALTDIGEGDVIFKAVFTSISGSSMLVESGNNTLVDFIAMEVG